MTENDRALSEEEIEETIVRAVAGWNLDGKRVLVVVPDGTRTMPLPLFFRLLAKHLLPLVQALDFIVALGTHPYLDQAEVLRLFGLSEDERRERYAQVGLLIHRWKDSRTFVELGQIPGREVQALSEGRLHRSIDVRINRAALEHDHIIICGPVFPHEVVGFSGGNKYFFPGLSTGAIIDQTHWLGALLTSNAIIGHKHTPVRRLIDRAAQMIPIPRHALCAVVTQHGVAGLFAATPEEAWSRAADLSAQLHVVYVERPYRRVLAALPEMYDELWVGAKGMYKTEPVVADGGEVILYAPHLQSISQTHGVWIEKVGYHVAEYFQKQWDQFLDIPLAVLAHSTHVKGPGTYTDGVERPRIQVTLATGIPEAVCRSVNLGYANPASIDPEDWAGREGQGILLVRHAGETLYRLIADQPAHPTDANTLANIE